MISRACRSGTAFFVFALMAGLAGCSKQEPAAKPTAAPAAAAPAAAPAAPVDNAPPPEVQRMVGRWLRSDGTYALEIRGADKSGVVQAGYFNPKSINVSRAIWMRGPEGLQVIVELNDVGYPGATYVLSHDAAEDRLVGKYNQPQMGQSFDVDFVRQKKFP
ncbi:MAG: hypothetical protein RLZZ188_280 [Verrucomicrobiota bacterium]|jgi:hypothetical protein